MVPHWHWQMLVPTPYRHLGVSPLDFLIHHEANVGARVFELNRDRRLGRHKHELSRTKRSMKDADSISFQLYTTGIHLFQMSLKWLEDIRLPILSYEPSYPCSGIMPLARHICINHPIRRRKRTFFWSPVVPKIKHVLQTRRTYNHWRSNKKLTISHRNSNHKFNQRISVNLAAMSFASK